MSENAQNLLFIFLTACILGSIFVWWQVARRLRAKQPALPLRESLRRPPSAMSVPLALVIWVATPLVVAGLIPVGPDRPLHDVQVLCLSNVLVPLFVLLVLTDGGTLPASGFGIDFSRWKQDIVDGARGFLASVLPVGLVLAATQPLRTPETQHPLLKLLREQPGPETTLWIALGAVVLAPLAEELVYRVVLQGWLQSKIGPGRAIVAVALMFAVVHGWPDCLPLIPLALILGYVYYRRHSYPAVVVLHMLFNATNLSLALLAQQAEAAKAVAALSQGQVP